MSDAEFMELTITPEAERRWRLARREDLVDVVGMVLTVPFHGQDEFGTWRYGVRPLGGMPHSGIVDQFNAEMREIVVESVAPLENAGLLSAYDVEELDSHPYESGPAAQSWPQFFFEIYQQVQPALTEAATLIAIAQFLKDAYHGIDEWKNRKLEETSALAGDYNIIQPYAELDPRPVFTLPGLVALAYSHASQHYNLPEDVEIDVFPRNRFGNYASPDHPSGNESYVIRLTAGDIAFHYLLNGRCEVFEHYQTAGNHFQLLPFPDLLLSERSNSRYREAEGSHRFVVHRSAS